MISKCELKMLGLFRNLEQGADLRILNLFHHFGLNYGIFENLIKGNGECHVGKG